MRVAPVRHRGVAHVSRNPFGVKQPIPDGARLELHACGPRYKQIGPRPSWVNSAGFPMSAEGSPETHPLPIAHSVVLRGEAPDQIIDLGPRLSGQIDQKFGSTWRQPGLGIPRQSSLRRAP